MHVYSINTNICDHLCALPSYLSLSSDLYVQTLNIPGGNAGGGARRSIVNSSLRLFQLLE